MSLPAPGLVPPVLAKALAKQDPERRQALTAHLLGGTSADYLSGWFRRAGAPVGATTIKKYRRSLDSE